MRRVVWAMVYGGLLLEAWQCIVLGGFVSTSLFPPPSRVAEALWQFLLSGTLLSDMRESLWRLAVGLAIGSAIGTGLGLSTGRSLLAARVFEPLIQIFRPLPPVAIIPLVIVWFGIGDGAKVFSIAFAVFFPVWLNTHSAARRVPQVLLWSAALLTRSRTKRMLRVILPSILPSIIAGVRIGIATAFVMVFVSELSGASGGLGYRISVTQLAYRIDQMMASLIVLGALGALVDTLFVTAARHAFPWISRSS